MNKKTIQKNPKLDLVLERVVDVPRELVWAAWTTPKHLKKWFTPAPWKTIEAQVDLRPGGIFRTVFLSPEGEKHPNDGCFLEVIENERLTWTSALGAGFRPLNPVAGIPVFTAVLSLKSVGKRTRYNATVIHADEATRKAHDAMGFQDGWGKALDQLVDYMKKAGARK